MADALRGVKMLDAMTVYKDRRPYPHQAGERRRGVPLADAEHAPGD